MADIERVKRNIQRMIDQGAPESDIDTYIASEGVSINQLKEAPKDQKMGRGQAFKVGVKQGATFGFADELQSGIAAGVAYPFAPEGMGYGDLYNMQLQQEREELSRAKEDRPMTTLAGEVIGGGMTGGAAATRVGGQRLATQMATKPLRTSAALGGVSGGVYGFGTGEGGAQERLGQAGISGGVGALAGPAGSYIGSKIPKYLRKKPAQIADDFSFETLAARQVTEQAPETSFTGTQRGIKQIESAIKKDYPDNFEDVLQLWKSGDVTLAEIAGPNLTRKMKGAAQYAPGEVRSKQFFGERLAETPERLMQSINKNVTGADAYYATLDDMLAAGRKAAKPLYEDAYKFNKSMNSNQLNRVMNAPAAKQALKEVAEETRNRLQLVAKPEPELTALAKELESIGKMQSTKGGVAQGLPLRVLDSVKKKLDKKIGTLDRRVKMGSATSADSDELQSLMTIKNELVSEIDNLDKTGLYTKAREKSGDYLRSRDTMEAGRTFDKIDPELLTRQLKELPEAEKQAFRVGVGKRMRDIIDNTQDMRNPKSKILGSETQRKRLKAILTPEQYRNLQKTVLAEDKLFQLRNEVLGGSPTTSKAMAAMDIANQGGDALELLATGNPKSLGLSAITGAVKKMFDGINDDTANAIAKIAFETDPSKKVMLIQKVSGNKALSKAEQETVKRAYFTLDNMIRSRATGASSAAVLASPDMEE